MTENLLFSVIYRKFQQKYIENVLLLECLDNRKFDIRLWVLMKGSFDAQMYYYQDFYGRVCS